jgi:hypothetical protein
MPTLRWRLIICPTLAAHGSPAMAWEKAGPESRVRARQASDLVGDDASAITAPHLAFLSWRFDPKGACAELGLAGVRDQGVLR